MRRCRAVPAPKFATPRWPRLAPARSPPRGRRSPPCLIRRASSGRTSGLPMHGEASPAWRLATSIAVTSPAAGEAPRPSISGSVGPSNSCPRRPARPASSGHTGGPPMHGEALWPRRPAPAALQCHARHAGLAVVLYDIFGPHGRPSDATVAPGNVAVASPGIFGPHGRPSDTRRGHRGASPPAGRPLRISAGG